MLEKLMELDGEILLWIQDNLRADFLNPLVKGITYLGNGGILMIAACLILMIIPKTRRLGAVCALSLALEFIICNLLLKTTIARTRPYETVDGLTRIIGKQSDYSFPSGHSGASFAVASVIFREAPKRIGIPILILAFLIALSRLYVGVHFPTDVIAGIILGTLTGIAACFAYHRITKSKEKIFS